MHENPTAPIQRDRWILARIADGEPLRVVAERDGVSQDGLYRRLRRACDHAGVANTFALLALAVEQAWIVRSFEGWIVPDPDAPKRGHVYLSTSCLHGDMVLPDGRTGHEYCQGETGHCGAKVPHSCKFCGTNCVCTCHDTVKVAPVRGGGPS
jgi:hypothetical protein